MQLPGQRRPGIHWPERALRGVGAAALGLRDSTVDCCLLSGGPTTCTSDRLVAAVEARADSVERLAAAEDGRSSVPSRFFRVADEALAPLPLIGLALVQRRVLRVDPPLAKVRGALTDVRPVVSGIGFGVAFVGRSLAPVRDRLALMSGQGSTAVGVAHVSSLLHVVERRARLTRLPLRSPSPRRADT